MECFFLIVFFLQVNEPSDVTKEMEAWHASVLEKLKISENRKPFDLKAYGRQMLDMLNSTRTISFSEILKNKGAEDVSRYFLSTLDLVIFVFLLNFVIYS